LAGFEAETKSSSINDYAKLLVKMDLEMTYQSGSPKQINERVKDLQVPLFEVDI